MNGNQQIIDLPKGECKITESNLSFERGEKRITIKYRTEERSLGDVQITEKEKIKVMTKDDVISVLEVNSSEENGVFKKIVEQAVVKNTENGCRVRRHKRIIVGERIVSEFFTDEKNEWGVLYGIHDYVGKKISVCETRL